MTSREASLFLLRKDQFLANQFFEGVFSDPNLYQPWDKNADTASRRPLAGAQFIAGSSLLTADSHMPAGHFDSNQPRIPVADMGLSSSPHFSRPFAPSKSSPLTRGSALTIDTSLTKDTSTAANESPGNEKKTGQWR